MRLSACRLIIIGSTAALAPAAAHAQSAQSAGTDATPSMVLRQGATVVVPTPPVAQTEDGTTVITLPVVEFVPPSAGEAEVVVSAQAAGVDEAEEIGRFSIFPSQRFKARKPDAFKRFTFQAPPCPPSHAQTCSYILTIAFGETSRWSQAVRLKMAPPEITHR